MFLPAALVIRGFVIRAFGNLRTLNYVQNLFFADFSLGYRRIRYFLRTKDHKRQKHWSLVILIFGICGILYSGDVNPVNTKRNLYFKIRNSWSTYWNNFLKKSFSNIGDWLICLQSKLWSMRTWMKEKQKMQTKAKNKNHECFWSSGKQGVAKPFTNACSFKGYRYK